MKSRWLRNVVLVRFFLLSNVSQNVYFCESSNSIFNRGFEQPGPERFLFLFWSILNGVTLKTSNYGQWGFMVLDYGFRRLSDIEGNSRNKYIYACSFLVGKHCKPQSINATLSTHNNNRHSVHGRVHFYAFVETAMFWLQAREFRVSVCFNTFLNFNRSLNKRRMSPVQTIGTEWIAGCKGKKRPYTS